MSANDLLNECRHLIETHRAEIIAAAQSLVRVNSPSGQEGEVAALVQALMQKLEFDETWVDKAGNVIGIVRGGDGPVTMFNGHMDVVSPGNPADWAHPVFGAEIHDGLMWGRGSADMKCPLTAMIYAAGLFKRWGVQPAGDIIVTAVVMEEIGGWGTHWLLEDPRLHAGRAVVGEPTNNRLMPGHRVRMVLQAALSGTSVHSSQPNLDVNPLYSLARFINDLPDVTASLRDKLGFLTITPTTLVCPPGSNNITPPTVTQTLDVRAEPDVEPEALLPALNELLQNSLSSGCAGRVEAARQTVQTYTGLQLEVADLFPGYQLSAEHPWAIECEQKLAPLLGDGDLWAEPARFTCDASRLHLAGIPTVMFGPGDIAVAHTAREIISINQFLESVAAYMALVWP